MERLQQRSLLIVEQRGAMGYGGAPKHLTQQRSYRDGSGRLDCGRAHPPVLAIALVPLVRTSALVVTGPNRERPGFREALAACRGGGTLVVTKLDRLARSATGTATS